MVDPGIGERSDHPGRAHRFDGFIGITGGLQFIYSLCNDEKDIPQPPKAGTDQWVYQIQTDYLIRHRITLPASISS